MTNFQKHFDFLNTKELIEYFCVFDGFYNLELLKEKENLIENIIDNVLKNFHTIYKQYIFSSNKSFQNDIEKLLYRLAIGDAKSYSVYKNDISFYRGKSIYKILFEKNILKKEISREEIPIFLKKKKKIYRGYQKENKIRFVKNFDKFWFFFIYPFKDELKEYKFSNCLENLNKNLDRFIGQNFEFLANELIKQKKDITEVGHYWDQFVEFDVYAKDKNGKIYVGECKWTNHKINTNILNKLKKKCQKVGFEVDFFLLFSKSGYSKELLKNKEKNIILYDIDDFEELFCEE